MKDLLSVEDWGIALISAFGIWGLIGFTGVLQVLQE